MKSFLYSYIIWIIGNAFLVNFGGVIDDFVKVIALLGMCVSIISKHWKKKEVFVYGIFTILCFVTFYFNKETDVIVLAILILAGKNIDIYRLARLDVFTRSICMVLTILFYGFDLLSGFNMVEPSSYFGIRYSLGYSHPNNLFTQVFLIVVGILLTNHRRLKTKHYLLLVIFNVLFGIITYSRTGMIVLTILIILIALRNKKITNNFLFRLFAKYSFIICGAFTMYAIYLYNKGLTLAYVVDSLVSGRIMFASRIINEYGIGLWGKDITYVGSAEIAKAGGEAVILDSLYPYMLVSYGIIFSIIFLLIVICVQKVLLANKENVLYIVMMCFAIYSITQRSFISVNSNFTLIVLSIGLDCIINRSNVTKTRYCIHA